MGRTYNCWMLNCWCITWPVGFKRLNTTSHSKFIYSRIPCIQNPCNQTSARVSNISHYETGPKFHSLVSENLHLPVIFISTYKHLAFSIIICPAMNFPSEHIPVNHWARCTNTGCFVCHLKRPFQLSLDATNNHMWSFCFFISQTI